MEKEEFRLDEKLILRKLALVIWAISKSLLECLGSVLILRLYKRPYKPSFGSIPNILHAYMMVHVYNFIIIHLLEGVFLHSLIFRPC